jgi:hypothetical protein
MPWTRASAPFVPLQRIFETEEQLRTFKRTASRNNAVHASHIEVLEKAGCKDWELCNYGASYVVTVARPLALIKELDKVLGLSLRQLRQLKGSTLKLADTYERLFNAPLVPADVPILLPGRLTREGTFKTHCYLKQLTDAGVKFKSFTEQYVDSLGVFGDAIIGLLAALAQQERIRISERTKAGIERNRARGKTWRRGPNRKYKAGEPSRTTLWRRAKKGNYAVAK